MKEKWIWMRRKCMCVCGGVGTRRRGPEESVVQTNICEKKKNNK